MHPQKFSEGAPRGPRKSPDMTRSYSLRQCPFPLIAPLAVKCNTHFGVNVRRGVGGPQMPWQGCTPYVPDQRKAVHTCDLLTSSKWH